MIADIYLKGIHDIVTYRNGQIIVDGIKYNPGKVFDLDGVLYRSAYGFMVGAGFDGHLFKVNGSISDDIDLSMGGKFLVKNGTIKQIAPRFNR